MAASDSFMLPAYNFSKKQIPAKMFFCELCKMFKNIFWQNSSEWLLRKFICEFWVFQNTSFIQNLWETAYFMYKLQNCNQEIQWKSISPVVFKYFMQEREGNLLKILENYLWRGSRSQPVSLQKKLFHISSLIFYKSIRITSSEEALKVCEQNFFQEIVVLEKSKK